MPEDDQPNPDAILKAIQQEETKKNLGKLKIFFGMSAGVGKTYAMLEEAQQRLKEGLQIVVGTINTHGRQETENLLKGLPLIPEKWVKYKETVFEEMDLEAILQLKPAIVLVDELAHTNVPGSQHAKRWQDVIELLDSGIDVYTTLNVQHVESRKDLVESFAEIQIRETVPDLILERATTIELVDISPENLLQRLKEGKVYLGQQSKIAANHFFKEDTLTALREIALRFTAEKVDHDLHSLLSQGKSWKTREKLMVAISASPSSQQLIRRTRRKAFELDAPWVVVYIDTGKPLSDKEQTLLTTHLNLAQELGAEVITTYDSDIATALQNIAKQKNVTQLIIGRSIPHRVWDFFHKSLADRIEEKNHHLDLVILCPDRLSQVYQGIFSPFQFKKHLLYDYGIAILTVMGIGFLGFLLLPLIGYKSVGHLFLLGILLLSFFIGPAPIFFAAILSTLSWNFFFMPPIFSFAIPQGEDLALTIIYFCTAALLGVSTSRIHKQDRLLKLREKKLEHLYEIEREITNAPNFLSLRLTISSLLQPIFNGHFDLLIKNKEGNQLLFDSKLSLLQQEKEQIVALWAYQHGKIAGWSTAILPAARGLYLPIKFSKNTLGILVFVPNKERTLTIAESNFLQTVTQQLGTYLERYLFEEHKLNQAYTNQAEKLHVSILHSISQRFHTPLHHIFEALQHFQLNSHPKEVQSFVQTIEKAGRNLEVMINNFLISAEIESGFVKLEKNAYPLQDFIHTCLQEFQSFLKDQTIDLNFPNAPILLFFDPRLMKIALKNVLIYLTIFSLSPRRITLQYQAEENMCKISIIQKHSSISLDTFSHLLDSSPQVSSVKFKEEIEGLEIAKSILTIHQGKMEAYFHEPHVLTFSFLLPSTSSHL